jgi:hypothetical protein
LFRAFNLSGLTPESFARWRPTGLSIAAKHQEAVITSLASFATATTPDGADNSPKTWSPQIPADVFISHSRRDTELAAELAGWLSDVFELRPFMDSSISGNIDEVLVQIDNECPHAPSRDSESIERRNAATNHVHMMLASALGMMIDTTECVIFMNLPQPALAGQATNGTQSPWVYFELAMANMIRRRQPKRFTQPRESIEKRSPSGPELVDALDFSPSRTITVNILKEWERQYDPARNRALDLLYSLAPQERPTNGAASVKPAAHSRELFKSLLRGI